MMEFKGPYLQAMRQQAPQMFNRLRRTGALDKHVQDKTAEAHRMFNDLTANAPKLPSGQPKEPWAREAEEQVLAALIEFPPDGPEPKDPLQPLNE
jgi:hypothetical protein